MSNLPYKQWLLDAAEVFDAWRFVPRMLLFSYWSWVMVTVGKVLAWYMTLPSVERSLEASGLAAAVITAVTVMLLAADPLSRFIAKNPTIVMLALGFLLMIGMTLIADGMGFHVPKGYIYAAMGFSALVEGLNMLARRRKAKGGGR